MDIKKSKYISKLLRHDHEDLIMDKNGWVSTKALMIRVGINRAELDEIVNDNNKKRFEYSNDNLKIRARQGHSIEVDVELKQIIPPELLYHGTGYKLLNTIFIDGIKKMKRLHVHLSGDVETAINVGSRKGEACVLIINARQMHNDGHIFYLSNNGVYLTDYVPKMYLTIKED